MMQTVTAYNEVQRIRHEIQVLQDCVGRQLARNSHADIRFWQRKIENHLERLIRAGVEPAATCQCCGYQGLVRPRVKAGTILGPECVGHYPEKHCRGR